MAGWRPRVAQPVILGRNSMRHLITTLSATLVFIVGVGWIQPAGPAQDKRPRVAGAWTGTWGLYSPPKPGEPPPQSQKVMPQAQLDCKVSELTSGKWQATFEGECGRPYKYTIQMVGRQS